LRPAPAGAGRVSLRSSELKPERPPRRASEMKRLPPLLRGGSLFSFRLHQLDDGHLGGVASSSRAPYPSPRRTAEGLTRSAAPPLPSRAARRALPGAPGPPRRAPEMKKLPSLLRDGSLFSFRLHQLDDGHLGGVASSSRAPYPSPHRTAVGLTRSA